MKELQSTLQDNHGYIYKAWMEGSNLKIKEITGRTAGTWSWPVSSFNDRSSDGLYLDYGQKWYVTGMVALIKEMSSVTA